MFNSAKEFSIHIESIASEKNINHFDALIEYCTENNVEPDDVVKLIDANLRKKIEIHCEKRNLIIKKNKDNSNEIF